MRYWDSSALVPVFLAEPATEMARQWLADDPQIITWGWSRVEVVSALERRVREARVSREERSRITARLEGMAQMWREVTDVQAVRTRAMAFLARHPLRAADAAQLGAAHLAAEGDPSSLTLVCVDRRLAEAAEREGFRVLSTP